MSRHLFREELEKRIKDGRVVLEYKTPKEEICRVVEGSHDRIRVVGTAAPPSFSYDLGNGGYRRVRKHP